MSLRCILISLFTTGIISIIPIKYANAVTLTKEQEMVGDTSSFFGLNIKYGDINGDGITDLISADNLYDTNRGRLFIYFGANSAFNTSPDITIYGEAQSNFFTGGNGYNLGTSDLDGDGNDDVVVSACGYSSSIGAIYYLRGNELTSGTHSVADVYYDKAVGNTTTKKYLGNGLKLADVNQDGWVDIIVTAGTSSYTTSSKLFVFLNDQGEFDLDNPNYTYTSSNTYNFGAYALLVGDFDGEGYLDFLVSDRYWDATGHGVYYLKNNVSISLDDGVLFTNEVVGDYLGRHLTESQDDINHDGVTDFCLGGYMNDHNATDAGSVYCWYGRDNFSGTINAGDADIIIRGEEEQDNFGRSTFLYDLTNDGYPELLVGAYQTSKPVGEKDGKFYVFKYDSDIGDYEADPWYYQAPGADTLFSNTVSAVDYDNDGYVNILVTQGGNNSSGTGDPQINVYSIDHSSVSWSDLNLSTGSPTQDDYVSGVVNYFTANFTPSTVEWSTSNDLYGTWTACTAADGAFDKASEEFSCALPEYSEGDEIDIYLRSADQDYLYITQSEYEFIGGVLVDRSSPSGASLVSSNITNNRTITLSLSADDTLSDVTEMMLSENSNFSGASWESFNSTRQWILSDRDGLKTIYIKYRDAAANESDTYTKEITLDTNHPLKPKLNLQYQTKATKNDNVDRYFEPESQDFVVGQNRFKLYFDVKEETTEVEQIMVCERQDFRRCAWKNYDGDYNIELSDGEEKKRLYFKFKDTAGNISDTYSQLVKLDQTAPELSLTKIGKIDYDPQYKVYYYTVPNPLLQGETEPKSWVKVWVDGSLYGNEVHARDTSEGKWSTQGSNLSYGKHSVLIESEDQAGNKSDIKFDLIIDPNR